MELERQPSDNNEMSPAAKIAVGALALWAGLTLIQWVVLSAFRFVRFGLIVAVAVAVIALVVGGSSSDRR